ncbi:MAG: PAS domain S-box protein [Deltaproteobacteria bacterium]|nr:PAS domain S-box protein [Deltaproteobacteria bacterium]
MKMPTFSLFQKALIAVAAMLVPIFIIFLYGYRANERFLRANSLSSLTVIADAYEGQVYLFLEMSKRRAMDFSSDGFIRDELEKAASGSASAAGPLNRHLIRNKLPLDRSIDRIYVIASNGRVVAATNEAAIGKDASDEQFFLRGREGVAIYERHTAYGDSEIAVAAPVTDKRTGGRIGVIVNFISFGEVGKLLSGAFSEELGAVSWNKGRHKSMDIYLVNRDMTMITGNERSAAGGIKQRVDTASVRACIASGTEFSGFYKGYKGATVAGASMCLPQMNWTLLVEVAEDEIVSPLNEMKRNVLAAAGIVVILIAAVFFSFFEVVVMRLRALAVAAGRVADGDYGASVPIMAYDEIGALAGTFNRMASEVWRRDAMLRQSEERLRAIIDNSTAVIYLKGLDGRFLLVNRRFEELSGLAPGGALGKTDYDIFPDDDASMLRANDMTVVHTRMPHEFEETVTEGGVVRNYLSMKVPIYDSSGAPFAVCGISTDITERKRMVDELRLLQTLSTALGEARDFNGALKTAIGKVCEVTGWAFGEAWAPSKDGIVLEYCSECIDEAADNGLAECARGMKLPPDKGLAGRVWASKKTEWVKDVSMNGETFIRAEAASRQKLHAAVGIPIVSENNVMAVLLFFTRSSAATRDERFAVLLSTVSAQLGAIVSRKLAEEARREMAERYESLVNNLSIGVSRNTPGLDGRFIEVNQTLLDMLECPSREELLKHGVAEFYADPAERAAFSERLIREGFVKNVVVEVVTLKGKRRWASISAVKKADRDGNVFFDCMVEDITERKSLEEQLRHSQKLEAIGRLSGGIAHDFNNILAAVIGYANLLKMKKDGDETVVSYSGHILTLAERAARLTSGLLAFSRKQVITPQPVELNGLVRHVGEILQRIIGEDIEFRTVLHDGELVIMADAAQIEQALTNLVTNAVDAMPRGGALTIATQPVELDSEFINPHGYGAPGRYALLTVTDTGTGMDAETVKRIFEPFFTTKEVGKGTGLGLSMVYGTVKQHEGYINVYSEPGAGTSIKVYLPLASGEAAGADAVEPRPVTGGTEHILVVEDEPDVRAITRTVLEEYGYRVTEAANGEEAVLRFREAADSIGLVILDVIMPRMGGKEAYEELRRIRPGVKVLFTSGYAEDFIKAKSGGEMAFAFLIKPAAPGALLRKIREALDR